MASSMPALPDFQYQDDPFSTAGDMKFHLQDLLESKTTQLQQAGSLGQRVLAQQMELEERIRQLQELEAHKGEDDTIDQEARERYQELAETILAWDAENAQLSSAFGSSSQRQANGSTHSPIVPFADLPRGGDDSERNTKAATGTSAAQSRRAKNAAHRADDVEFAFEIGSGLLTEVRRLQSLLGERDKAIQDMKEEKDDLEKTVESLRTALRQQEQNADKFKEENWNLEVTLQELRAQLTESQSSVQRLEGDQKRITKALSVARDTGDQHKNEAERLQNVVQDMKAKHETDIAQARKHAAGLARDKSDLQQTIDTMKAEQARARRFPSRFGVGASGGPLTPGVGETRDFLTPLNGEDGDDLFGTTGGASTRRKNYDTSALFPPDELGSDFADSPDPSPVRKPFLAANHPSNEIEVLQQRLAHAQRQINTLKGSLVREKQARLRGETGSTGVEDEDEVEEEEVEEDFIAENNENKKPATGKRLTPFRVGASSRGARGGRGRGRGGMTLIQRLGMAANDVDDEEDIPPVPPIQFNQAQEDEDEVSQFFGSSTSQGPLREEDLLSLDDNKDERDRSPSPTHKVPSNRDSIISTISNRTSVDGMDPAFANVLKRVPSNGSTHSYSSPLRQSIFTRSTRGGTVGSRRPRGGAAFKEARPPSIVDAPEVLAAELLGGSMDADTSLKGVNSSLLAEEGILEEEEDGVEYIRVKKVEKVELGCQTDDLGVVDEKTVVLPAVPVIEEAAPPVPSKPEPIREEMGVQCDPIEIPAPVVIPPSSPPSPKPSTVDMDVQTEEELKTDIATQYNIPVAVKVDSGVGTDPIPEPTTLPSIGRGLPPIITSDYSANTSRRTTLTQADISTSTSGDTTITRSFLAARGPQQVEEEFEDDIDEGEETETGADTEDDYHDARQSIAMSTPSEDFHSVLTMTDNDYSDSEGEESDGESIKASHFSMRSTTSLNNVGVSGAGASYGRPETASSYYSSSGIPMSLKEPSLSYEDASVGADLTEPVEPIVKYVEVPVEVRVEVPVEVPVEVKVPYEVRVPVEVPVMVPAPPVPKPEVKEMSIQTDDLPAPPVPTPAPAVKPVPTSPGLYRVGSGTSHQFQFIPPPAPSAGTSNSGSLTRPSTASSIGVINPPSSAPPTTGNVFTAPSPVPTPLSSIFRESTGTFGRRTTASDRRQSIESLISSGTNLDENAPRSRVPSSSLLVVDKTRPPTISLPPPPKAPPPPAAMLPPDFIPQRRTLTTSTMSSSYSEDRPPRPSSPPPAELIQRATTPLGSVLSVPSTVGKNSFPTWRQPGSSVPPPISANLRQPVSTSSFRSAAHAGHSAQAFQNQMNKEREQQRREFSTTSLMSERSGAASPRSSISSDHHPYNHSPVVEAPSTPSKNNADADTTPKAINNLGPTGAATDPTIIHAITQTMIGEFLYKYTRKSIGKGVGEKRHKRFFWVHPYTKTLYWSSADPGSSNVTESSAKSAYIEGVRSVLDPNPMPPGLYQYSVVVSTPQREMKITCPTKDRHDIWINALKYLLSRPNNPSVTSPASNTILPQTPGSHTDDERRPTLVSPTSQRATRTMHNGDTWNSTPRGQRSRSQLSVGGSVSKRSGTPALEYLRWNGPESPFSPEKSFVDVPAHDPDELDFELHDESMSDEGFEGLENVRACCDGRHTVGHSGKIHHHHHHHHHHPPSQTSNQGTLTGTLSNRRSVDNQHLDPAVLEQNRPSSPAWSFRSRGSTHSHEGSGGGLFSWGRGEDGKLRFGSRRSTKSSVPMPHDS